MRASSCKPSAGTAAAKRRLAIIELARSQHEREGQVEIDDDAPLSEGRDNGCYVQAWVWIDFSGTRFEQETDAVRP